MNTQSYMYDGWTGAGGNIYSASPITAAVHPSAGQAVCTSGATSEVRCGFLAAIVYAASWQLECEEGGVNCFWAYVWVAASASNRQIVAGGDSGGPLYMPSIYGNLAVGGITSGSNRVPCDHIAPGVGSPPCYTQVFFADVYTETSRRGLKIG